METLEQVLVHWSGDSVIDQTIPGKELIRIPVLHNKYLSMLTRHRVAAKKSYFDYLRMKKLKWEYYTGKMTKEDISKHGWEPFQYTLKSDISIYIDSDTDLIKLMEKKFYHEETVSVLESILTELKSRTFQLRDFIVYERFITGG